MPVTSSLFLRDKSVRSVIHMIPVKMKSRSAICKNAFVSPLSITEYQRKYLVETMWAYSSLNTLISGEEHTKTFFHVLFSSPRLNAQKKELLRR